MMPRYPIYVPSRNRYQPERAGTIRALQADDVPFYLVLEPKQVRHYERWGVDPNRILVLPEDDYGTSIVARNFIRDHAEASGARKHWQLDDNIWWFARLWEGRRIRCHAGVALRVCEDLSDRFVNVGISGLNYDMFVTATMPVPFHRNVHVYSATLINHDMPYRHRLRYNEDTDICLQALTNGWATILVNAFMAKKQTTMTGMGGNSDTLYGADGSGSDTTGRYEMARTLEREWPGTVKVIRNFGRYQHSVNWRAFDVPLRLDPDALWMPEPDEYRLTLRALEPPRSPRIRALVEDYPAVLASITGPPEPYWGGLPAFRAATEPLKLRIQCRTEQDRQALVDRLSVTIDKRFEGKGWSTWWPPRGRDDPRTIAFMVAERCPRCSGSGVEPGTVVIPAGHGSGFNSLDPDPLDRGSYVPCHACHGRAERAPETPEGALF